MDIALVSELIDDQFPELAPSRAAYLGEGCDSTAFTVNGAWVFRFPKNEEVAAQFEIEARILPELAARLPVPVPQFRFHGMPAPRFQSTFVGYPKLPGEPGFRLVQNPFPPVLLEQLARALSAVHSVPLEIARHAGVPDQPLDGLVTEVRSDALGDLPRVREVLPDAPIDRWRAFIEAGIDAGGQRPVTLVHNDFAAEHVLLDPRTGAITGIIDWSDIAIGDPAIDFAGLFHWGGEPLVRGVLGAYTGSVDEDALCLARYLAACRGAMDVAFGLDRRRPEYVAAGLRALQQAAGEGGGGSGARRGAGVRS